MGHGPAGLKGFVVKLPASPSQGGVAPKLKFKLYAPPEKGMDPGTQAMDLSIWRTGQLLYTAHANAGQLDPNTRHTKYTFAPAQGTSSFEKLTFSGSRRNPGSWSMTAYGLDLSGLDLTAGEFSVELAVGEARFLTRAACTLNRQGTKLKCRPISTWGDGRLDPGEACERIPITEATCTTLGFDGGVLGCAADCSFDTSECSRCGNGIREQDEQCDGQDLRREFCQTRGYLGGILACAGDCTFDESGCVPVPP
jgi:hypothetical protein